MRFKYKSNKPMFTILPHKCINCGDWVWLDKMVRHKNSYGDIFYYCKDCAKNRLIMEENK